MYDRVDQMPLIFDPLDPQKPDGHLTGCLEIFSLWMPSKSFALNFELNSAQTSENIR
jgi:hypothetical protein